MSDLFWMVLYVGTLLVLFGSVYAPLTAFDRWARRKLAATDAELPCAVVTESP